MSKYLKSTDERKPKVVAALKRHSGGTKVTMVRAITESRFSGHCYKPEVMAHPQGFMIRTGKYEYLGLFTVKIPKGEL